MAGYKVMYKVLWTQKASSGTWYVLKHFAKGIVQTSKSL